MCSLSCVSYRTDCSTSIAAYGVNAVVSSATASVVCFALVDIYIIMNKAVFVQNVAFVYVTYRFRYFSVSSISWFTTSNSCTSKAACETEIMIWTSARYTGWSKKVIPLF